MINALFSLGGKYKDKTIYVWDVNRDSMVVFMWLAFAQIDIKGFVADEEYAGKVYMNRIVVGIKQICNDENAIILVSENVPEAKVCMLPSKKVLYWKNILELNDDLMQKKVIVYGIGAGAEALCNQLSLKGIEPSLFCVTKKDGDVQYRGKDVIEAEELIEYEDCAVIISVVNRKFRREIRKELALFKGEIYMELEYILDPPMMREVNFMQHINLAIHNRKKIYLYGERDALSQLIETVLRIYDIEISGYAHCMPDEEHGVQSIYELAYEGVEDKFIIINEDLPERFSNTAYVRNSSVSVDEEALKRFLRARENVELAGFSLEGDNYTSLQWYEMSSEYFLLNLIHDYDPLVGFTLSYIGGRPGWKIYGKESKESIRIIVLGGSTSSEILHPENWVSKLYYKLKRAGINIVIYNGAHGDNDIVDEILRLMRDGAAINPHIVISMSGVNNLHYKDSANQFNPKALCFLMRGWAPNGKFCSGIYNQESLYSFWTRNENLLGAVTQFYGGKFFSFLQPNNLAMQYMSLQEKSLFEVEDDIIGAEAFRQSVNEEEDYVNLMHLFEHVSGMYTSVCHYTDKANEILANKVYEVIMPAIQELVMV